MDISDTTMQAKANRLQERFACITQATLDAYREHHKSGTLGAVPHLTQALPALAEVNAYYENVALLAWLLSCLQDKDLVVRFAAAEALMQMGEKAASPQILNGMLACLQDEEEEWDVLEAVTRTLGKMGEKVTVHPGVLQGLLARLQDEFWKVRDYNVVAALGKLGEKAATPEVMEGLLACLYDEDSVEFIVRDYAAEALGKMGERAAEYPEILEGLLACLRDKLEGVRSSAAWALGQMGEKVAEYTGVLPALLVCLQDEEDSVRYHAAWALEGMREIAAEYPGVLSSPLWILQKNIIDLRASLASSSLQAEEKSPTAEKLTGLLACLRDKKGGDRDEAAIALGKMGVKAATPEVLATLTQFLLDKDTGISFYAASILGNMGEKAAEYTRVTLGLLQCLREKGIVRSEAAQALGKWQEDGNIRLFEDPGTSPFAVPCDALAKGKHPFLLQGQSPTPEERRVKMEAEKLQLIARFRELEAQTEVEVIASDKISSA